MAQWKAFFVIFSVQLLVHYSQVTFLKFTAYPLTSKQARQAGWKKDASCKGRANFFYGNRYTKKGDDATRLIFDCDGSLAGMQATITPTDAFPTKHKQSPWLSTVDGRVAVTAYFRDPHKFASARESVKSA
ncbi:hypothetical protein OS493_012753 [Desmophyllum pertusum]|uniref:Uncharacterized protein n=1 Tax=Desmophyllum pertusum TaxID=174260 RepID=A0A9X0CYA6_9CNID|nr:hypothetical protein OS493_012753 [Desmophyllum pertusum]